MENNFDTVINLLSENKTDIIAVINSKTENIELQINHLAQEQKEDRKAIADLQGRTISIEKTLLIRGETCFKDIQDVKKYSKAFTVIAWVSRQKVISVIMLFVLLVLIQSIVYLVFKDVNTHEFLDKIFNKS